MRREKLIIGILVILPLFGYSQFTYVFDQSIEVQNQVFTTPGWHHSISQCYGRRSLAKGVYILKFRTGGRHVIGRVVKH